MSLNVLLERALPLSDSILEQLNNGELSIHGGVIRKPNGAIFKHLVFPQNLQESELVKSQLESNVTNMAGSANNAIESQMLGLAAMNVIAVKAAMQGVEQKLNEISEQLITMQDSLDSVVENTEFQSFLKVSEIEGQALGAIEEALIAIKTVTDNNFLRLHFMPVRQAFKLLETLITNMLDKMDNLRLVNNLDFLMLSVKMLNMSASVLSQLHFKLEEDDIAQGYLSKINRINSSLMDRIEDMKKTGSFTPHVISPNQFEKFKVDMVEYKRVENTALLLKNQNEFCLEHKVSHQGLLSFQGDSILMLDPITI